MCETRYGCSESWILYDHLTVLIGIIGGMVTASLFVFTEVAIELALGAGANVALLIWAYTLHEGHEVDEDGRQG